MSENALVKDYSGNLISKTKARKIMGKYYEEEKTCFLMEDNQWYRITSTDKITFDHFQKKYILIANHQMMEGIVDEDGKRGLFSDNPFYIKAFDKNSSKTGKGNNILNENIAKKLGYIESISDGFFYLKSELSAEDIKRIGTKCIPNNERSKVYNLQADAEGKSTLQACYDNYNPKISSTSKTIAKFIGDFTFGAELEVINGFLPQRIRTRLGVKNLKDGSLRWDGGEGIEYCSSVMKGAKGVQVLKELCEELSKRCDINNLCSLHFHFGKVRKDKLYVLSLYKVIRMVQCELKLYFPYSRFNSIRPDGKIYCHLLSDLSIDYKSINAAGSPEEFKDCVISEFNKIYRWLNDGKGLAEPSAPPTIVRNYATIDGKKMFYDKKYTEVFTTRSIKHAANGEKWNKQSRYFIVNFLNLFFNDIGTVEFRSHESTLNPTKCLIWLLVCACILHYADDVKGVFNKDKVELQDILESRLPPRYVAYIMGYMKFRHDLFFVKEGHNPEWKKVEGKWFKEDPNFSYIKNNMEIK